jgi:tRNA threonylcarbamoyladenosine biosynthesis protein TsaB
MSIILAIETSTETATAALLTGDRLSSRSTSGVHTHSASILPMVQALLHEAGITLAQCDAIAFGIGPGSFTGVRTACGVVQGLAFGADLPVLPVVTLAAMAQACYEHDGARDVLAVLDARMGEVYRYTEDTPNGPQHGWQTVIAPCLSVAAQVAPQGTVTACGNGLAVYAEAFAALPLVARHPAIMPAAQQVATLGALALARGEAVPLDEAQPLYLRNKIAFTTAERLAKLPV